MRPHWDEVFMSTVSIYEKRVTCVYYKIAAVLGNSKTGRLISVGYNGPIRGDVHCTEVGCAKEIKGVKLPPGSNRCRGVHAEINAFLNMIYLGIKIDREEIKNTTLYISVRPCLDCTKAIINTGIKRIVYCNDYDGDNNAVSFCRKHKVKLIRFKKHA